MVRAILFKDKRFKVTDDDNLLSPLTENTIILCNNCDLKNSLTKEICDTINGNAEYNEYDCDDADVGKAKVTFRFGLQSIIDINGQKITLALEPSIIYKATKKDDIWFAGWSGGFAGTTYEEFIYPIGVFKGSHDVWEKGLDEVYEMICSGRYGVYDGKWFHPRNNSEHKFYA